MLSVNTGVHLSYNVAAEAVEINGLVVLLRGLRTQSHSEAFAHVLACMQEAHLARVLSGADEIICTRCGQVHSGSDSLVRRGWRARQVRSLDGVLCFRLRQVTCRGCRRTWSPYQELLGLSARQRILEEVTEKLFAAVTQMSYAQSCRLGEEWLGVRVGPRTLHGWVQQKGAALRFTPDPHSSLLIADGTKCPVGSKPQGAEVRLSFQLLSRSEHCGRRAAQLRVVGLGVGEGSWPEALPASLDADLVVTDAEPALGAYVRDHFGGARHQLCEWHQVYTLDWSLIEDGVKKPRRRALQELLHRILFGADPIARKRMRYARLASRIGKWSPTAQRQLQRAASYLLYESPSAERTTSLAERQMREINRRVENGARWSDTGVLNLLRLRLARKHNPDDYARIWNAN